MGTPGPPTDGEAPDGRVLTVDEWERLGVPIKYRDDQPDFEEAKLPERERLEDWVREAVAGSSTGLYFCGPVGTGKSRALAWLTGRLFSQALRSDRTRLCYVRFRGAGQIVQDLLRRDGDHELARDAQECEVLMVDDLGAAYEHEWITSWFGETIEQRYADEKLTCYTSNIKPGELRLRRGWLRSADRLGETCYVIHTTGESLRRRPQRYTPDYRGLHLEGDQTPRVLNANGVVIPEDEVEGER